MKTFDEFLEATITTTDIKKSIKTINSIIDNWTKKYKPNIKKEDYTESSRPWLEGEMFFKKDKFTIEFSDADSAKQALENLIKTIESNNILKNIEFGKFEGESRGDFHKGKAEYMIANQRILSFTKNWTGTVEQEKFYLLVTKI